MSDIKEQSKTESQSLTATEESFTFMIRKLEKISNALYLITNYFPVQEPLRATLREKALRLLSTTHALKTHDSNGDIVSLNLTSALEELVSLLYVSRTAGLISESNVDILVGECRSIISLSSDKGLFIGPNLSSKTFEIQPEGSSVHPVTFVSAPRLSIPQNPVVSESITTQVAPSQVENTQQASVVVKADKPQKEKKEGVSGVKKKRRDAIVDVIRNRGEVSIKDIAREVRGCSQKTIQRELVDLVEEGVLRREGERRWSMYSLIS